MYSKTTNSKTTYWKMYFPVKILPAFTENVPGKNATRIRIRSINYILKVKHAHTFCLAHFFLCMYLKIFTSIEKFNIHHIFSADRGLKIGQRYHKLLNGDTLFPF